MQTGRDAERAVVSTRPFKPGMGFRDGKLYMFTGFAVTVLRPWGPKAGAWKKTRTTGWRPVRPRGRLFEAVLDGFFFPPPLEAGEAATTLPRWETGAAVQQRHGEPPISRFHRLIPRPAHELVHRFPDRHWHMLQLLNRVGAPAFQLTADAPALAYMIASSWCFGPRVRWHMRVARRLVGVKRRAALGWLGFPATESFARIVRKIPPASCRIPRLLYLRDVGHDPEVLRTLRHLPRVNSGTIRIVTDPELLPMVTSGFLAELCMVPEEDDYPWVPHLLRQIRMMADAMQPDRRLPSLRSYSHLGAVFHDLSQRRDRTVHPAANVPALPPPPVPGNESIIPLTTLEDLAEESRIQCNCVLSYADRVARGQACIYRVIAPEERATLSLICTAGEWQLDQLMAARNREVLPTTAEMVKEWVGRMSAGARGRCDR